MDQASPAFGRPGIAPTWSSSDKDFVTTALGPSRVWVTLGHGIINEVYWPATGEPQIRDLGFILAREGEWIDLKRARSYSVTLHAPHVPLPQVVHTGPDYRLTLRVVPDARRDVLLVSYALEGDYDLYVLIAPHLAGSGLGNTAWVDGSALFARGGDDALALVASPPFEQGSAGYVGASDGWQDFSLHGRMTWTFTRAEEGNVSLMGHASARDGVLALGFAETAEGAHTLATSSLIEGFAASDARFIEGWERWGDSLKLPEAARSHGAAVYAAACASAMVLEIHEDRTFPGAIVASLSVPWGNSSDSSGGYHLVWPRDLVQSAFGLLAAGQRDDAERVLGYLASTQRPAGDWHQNFFPDGRPYWTGVQLDTVGLPVVLAAKLREGGPLRLHGVPDMVRRAAGYLAATGPSTPQDRWEENAGCSPFTLAIEIAALVATADLLGGTDGDYALSLADYWNERVEAWSHVENTRLARELGVPGYYVRVGPPGGEWVGDHIILHNRGGATVPRDELVGMEFLALVRFGLRRGDDPRIQHSLAVADALLRVDTPSGPLYHRYNGDGYGEHTDGRPYDGTGTGRAWPLLTGERGHLALVLGEDPAPYMLTMTRAAGGCGLFPEQAWDAAAIPERHLVPGKPSGSAMPLIWAHAEFLQLLAGCDAGRPFQLLQVVDARYHRRRPTADTWHWRRDTPFTALPDGRALLIEDRLPFTLHFGFDGWTGAQDREAQSLGLDMFGVRLSAEELASHREINFTRRYIGEWEGRDFAVALGGQ